MHRVLLLLPLVFNSSSSTSISKSSNTAANGTFSVGLLGILKSLKGGKEYLL